MKLGDVADTALGKMLDRGRTRGAPEVRYLRNVNVQWGRIDTHDLQTMELADDERERFGVNPGDLLVCEGGEIGRAAIWRGDGEFIAFQKALHRIRATDAIDPVFLRYTLEWRAVDGTLQRLSTGSTIAHLPQQQLRSIPLRLPSLAEQHRIVKVLEEQLASVAVAGRALSLALLRTELALRSVADSLLGGSFARVKLRDVSQGLSNGIFVSRASMEVDGVPILRIGAVRRMALDLSDLRYSRLSQAELARRDALLAPGDVVFTRYNGNRHFVGACGVVPRSVLPLTFPDKLIRYRADLERVLPNYLAIACSFGDGRSQIARRIKTTAGQAGIAGSELGSVEIALPPMAVQLHIERRFVEMRESVDRLRGYIAEQQLRSDALRRSLLQAAFSGQLTGDPSGLDRAKEVVDGRSPTSHS